jgi:hypothetical protein
MLTKLTQKYLHLINTLKRLNFTFQKSEPWILKIFFFIFVIRPELLIFFKRFFFKRTSQDIGDLINLQSRIQDAEYVFKYKEKYLTLLESDSKHLKELKENGFCNVSEFLNLNVNQFLSCARKQRMYNSHVPIQSTKYSTELDGDINYYSLDPESPDLYDFYQNILIGKEIKKIINDYLGGSYFLYSINTMRSIPTKNKCFVTDLHRDIDDYHSLALFVYWTDTLSNDGATFYLPASHRKNINQSSGQYLEGCAGSAYLIDTYGLHCGNKNLAKERTVTWMRFSQRQWNVASVSDKNYLHFNYYDQLIFPSLGD